MLIGLSLFDPLGGIGQDIVGWIGHSISQGIGGFASWAIGGVIHAMQATTTPDFTSWFKGPWRAMLTVVAWLSVPILFIGVGTAALRGDLTSVLRRGLGAPVIMAIGTAVALPVTAGVLTLVNACCSLLVNMALGGDQGFGQGLGHLSDFALSATVTSGGSSLPGLATALIVALVGLAALVIWFVLALRGALLYLEVLAIPLALCGLYWGGTAHWIKRLVDLIIATILSQLVITMLMVLAAADLDSGQLSGSDTGAVGGDMTTLFLCLAFLILGSLALPMALKHVPAATEHAAAAASQISGPGRMTYMGSRVAGTAKMMGGSGGGSKALVKAGAAAGPIGLAATAGVGAAASTAKAGARAAAGANEGSDPSATRPPAGTGTGSSSSSGSPSPRGPIADSVTSDRAAGSATAGATAQAARSQPGRGQRRSPEGSAPSTPGSPDAPSAHETVQGAVQGAAGRAGRAPSSSTRKAPGGSHG
jgi:type IV secretion system protein TrbL